MTAPNGIQQKFFAKAESSFDTYVAFATTDGVDLRSLSVTPEQTRINIVGHTGSGSRQGEIKSREGGKWSLSSNLAPVSAGVAPDLGAMLKAAMGKETVVGGTSVTYAFDSSADPISLQIKRYAGLELSEMMNGADVEQLDIVIEDEPKIEMSGSFAGYGIVLGGATCNGAQSISATTISMQSGDGQRFKPGELISFADGEDNSGAGYLVTAVVTDTLTITPALAAGVADTVAIWAHALGQTITGAQIGGVDNTVTIGGVAAIIVSGKVSVKTDQRAREELAVKSTGLYKGTREVSGSLTLYLKAEAGNNVNVMNAWDLARQAMSITIGSTAGKRVVINMPATEIKVPSIDIQDDSQAMFTIEFNAYENSTGDDEMTLAFT